MQHQQELEESAEKIRKQNRRQKQERKTHKVEHESGRSLKKLWQKIVERSKAKQI